MNLTWVESTVHWPANRVDRYLISVSRLSATTGLATTLRPRTVFTVGWEGRGASAAGGFGVAEALASGARGGPCLDLCALVSGSLAMLLDVTGSWASAGCGCFAGVQELDLGAEGCASFLGDQVVDFGMAGFAWRSFVACGTCVPVWSASCDMTVCEATRQQ